MLAGPGKAPSPPSMLPLSQAAAATTVARIAVARRPFRSGDCTCRRIVRMQLHALDQTRLRPFSRGNGSMCDETPRPLDLSVGASFAQRLKLCDNRRRAAPNICDVRVTIGLARITHARPRNDRQWRVL